METARTQGLGKLFTVQEAQQILPLSRSKFYAGINDGSIPSIRIGRRVFVTESFLRQLTESA